MIRRITTIGLLAVGLSGCGATTVSEARFDSDNPATKLAAISRAGQLRDVSTVPHLIDQLDSDDPAVRMMAIIALDQIVGTRLGYNPYDSAEDRRPAVEAWAKTHRDAGADHSGIRHD